MAAVIRRKLSTAAAVAADAPGPDRALRLALGRAAQAEMALALVVRSLREDGRSLAELLDQTEPGMFLGVLEGRAEALGLMALSQDVLSAVVEHLTTGTITVLAQAPRKPTRIDAAMVMPLIDRMLAEFEAAFGPGDAVPDWVRGYRYASFLDDARPLGLLLEEGRYRVFRAEVALGPGARTGAILLALPAEGPTPRGSAAAPSAAEGAAFAAGLRGAVLDSPATLEAVLTRLRLPLQAVMGWAEGALVPLPLAQPGNMGLEAPRGRVVARVRLGQCAGARAVRLLPAEGGGGTATEEAEPPLAPPARGTVQTA